MKVRRHRVLLADGSPATYERSPNQSQGVIRPRWLVMHYTAGRSFDSSVRWLGSRDAKASAHFVIGRDGRITQMVDCNRKAWHAGKSIWQGVRGLNSHSIGIELDNAGRLKRQGGHWTAWFGRRIPDAEVVVAAHRHEDQEVGWHAYTEEQLDAALAVSSAVVRHYGLEDVLGHDDIAPGRKSDPGPAFPMDSFRAQLIGRAADVDEAPAWRTTTRLNIRSGPGTGHEVLSDGRSPLAQGTAVDVVDAHGAWRLVRVEPDGTAPFSGWVHGRYLREA